MINQQLLDFIKQQLSTGLTKEIISKQLLDNGWTEQDVGEGFGALATSTPPPTPSPIGTFTPSSYNNINSTISPTQTKNHSGKKIFLIILIIFLLAGGASAYYFKDNLVKLPIVKDFFQNKTPISEVPATRTTQEKNLPTQDSGAVATQQDQPQIVDGMLDCGTDANCFLQAIDKCSATKALVTVKQPVMENFVTLTYKLNLNGEKSGSCLFKMVTQNPVVVSNTEAYTYLLQEYLKAGIITQQKYNESINQPDITQEQKFWNTQNGNIFDCSIPNNVLKPLLVKALIARKWSVSDLSADVTIGGTKEGFDKYCKVLTPSGKTN